MPCGSSWPTIIKRADLTIFLDSLAQREKVLIQIGVLHFAHRVKSIVIGIKIEHPLRFSVISQCFALFSFIIVTLIFKFLRIFT